MRWCLEPPAESESDFFANLGRGTVQDAMEELLPETVRSQLKQRIETLYIEKYVEPSLESRAWDMAFNFDGFLQYIVPESTPRSDWETIVIGARQTPDADRRVVDFSYDSYGHWQLAWLEALKKIFRGALQMRADLEKRLDRERLDEVVRFEFPEFNGRPQMQEAVAQSNLGRFAGDKKARIVLTTMLTALRKRVPRGDGSEENERWATVHPGTSIVVSLWDDEAAKSC